LQIRSDAVNIDIILLELVYLHFKNQLNNLKKYIIFKNIMWKEIVVLEITYSLSQLIFLIVLFGSNVTSQYQNDFCFTAIRYLKLDI